MKSRDFEKAIDALGVQELKILEMVQGWRAHGHVTAVYAMIGDLTYLFWDASGRGFRFDLNPKTDGCRGVRNYQYLDYSRDRDFDLTFE